MKGKLICLLYQTNDLRYYRQATERRKSLESISSPWDRMNTILEVLGCEELVDKKISCRVSDQCLISYDELYV